jgi:signal transduction histidine kinase
MAEPGDEALAAELIRLRRRLERERSTRREAESIAERGLRDLYDQQQQLQLLERIATACNQRTSAEAILRFAVTEISSYAQWEIGHAYLVAVASESKRLESTGIWHAADPGALEAFRRVTEATPFGPNTGLPGRVLTTARPLWLSDLRTESNFPRLAFALDCGLKAASAFPVLSGSEVVAVLEFFAGTTREPSEPMLRVMAQIGLQIGRVMERQRTEERLRHWAVELSEARDQATAASNAKSAFLANMSHELRTPLNAIIGFSEMMRDAIMGPLDPRYRDYAGDIGSSGRYLLEIINDILDISKVEAGRLELREEPVSVVESVESCRRMITGTAMVASVSMSFDVAPSLPLIRSDTVRFKQLLLNILSNAVKFTPSGGRARLQAWLEADGLVIQVEDTGIGMNAEDIEIALVPFRQVEGALARRFRGTGLGLPLAKALVDLHGGQLEIKSALGRGTSVSIRLPRSRLLSSAA